MTDKFRQAVITFVNCNEKIARAAEAANKNIDKWPLEKLKTTDRICKDLANQREAARKIIFDDSIEKEDFTKEEADWVSGKLEPYVKINIES